MKKQSAVVQFKILNDQELINLWKEVQEISYELKDITNVHSPSQFYIAVDKLKALSDKLRRHFAGVTIQKGLES